MSREAGARPGTSTSSSSSRISAFSAFPGKPANHVNMNTNGTATLLDGSKAGSQPERSREAGVWLSTSSTSSKASRSSAFSAFRGTREGAGPAAPIGGSSVMGRQPMDSRESGVASACSSSWSSGSSSLAPPRPRSSHRHPEDSVSESQIDAKINEQLIGRVDIDKVHLASEVGSRSVQQSYAHYMGQAAEKTKVDLLVVIDATASMQPWIDAVKSTVSEIFRKAASLDDAYDLRFGILAYRDVHDGQGHFQSYDFTTRPEELETFLHRLRASGGGDLCEDVMGALVKAFHPDCTPFTWRDDPSVTKTLIHILDAPAHGRQFHGPSVAKYSNYDSHPEGITSFKGIDSGITVEMSADQILSCLRMDGVNYYIFMVTDEPLHMVRQFKKWYNSSQEQMKIRYLSAAETQAWMIDRDKIDVQKLVDSVWSSITKSVTTHRTCVEMGLTAERSSRMTPGTSSGLITSSAGGSSSHAVVKRGPPGS
uniref:VWFA domain-containing protein n=1 Tax=Chromera velia CCMP2878 TaxID=1169474 RepID=A0A0G4F0N5_9ALVE|eukprot:Cvel_14606.t1-p1 / transcript=Cvel_14606.t1 / gene=Cvel_14606 / organism=Chromera_velia_CCMP2878 / gene_product=Alpha-protein kinase vwkA, putative / transcript_product=Alpha-protein kinase vwkA, putative / location=Cvel_scaffold1044:37286-39433(-) / protein_length=481 / sequence_SO=supercontig / SO=protein_coding / is_pseudo=false